MPILVLIAYFCLLLSLLLCVVMLTHKPASLPTRVVGLISAAVVTSVFMGMVAYVLAMLTRGA